MSAKAGIHHRPEPLSLDSAKSDIFSHPFVRGMKPQHLRLLGDYSMPTALGAGEPIFREGDPADRFYLICKGTVALESYVHGKPIIQMIGPGDVLGWSWLVPPYIWHFNAKSMDAVKAVFIYATPLRELCESDHDLGYELMKRTAELMLKRLQAIRKQLLAMGLPNGGLTG